MKPEIANEIAGFLARKSGAEERLSLMAELGRNSEARSVLALLEAVGATELISISLPFSVASGATLHVGEGHLRPHLLDRISLADPDAGVEGMVARISRGKLPLWFKDRMTLRPDVGFSQDSVTFEVSARAREVSIHLNDSSASKRILEVWKDGGLIRQAPLEAFSNRPLPGFPLDSTLVFRSQGAEEGFYLHFARVDWENSDRWGACLTSAIRGRFPDALESLASLSGSDSPGTEARSAITAGLGVVSELFQSVQLSLNPVPAMRSIGSETSLPKLACSLFKNGVDTCWPGYRDSENIGRGTKAPGALASSSTELEGLLGACCNTPDQWLLPRDIPTEIADPCVREGYHALSGWSALLRGDTRGALDVFDGPIPSQGDPFGLRFGAALAKCILECGAGADLAANRDSTERVWSALFSRVIP